MTLQRVNVFLAGVLAVLIAGLCVPVIHSVRMKAAQTHTVNNMKMVCLALHNCHDVNKQLPAAFDRDRGMKTGYPISAHVRLLPYVDQQAVFDTFLLEGKGETDAIVPLFMSPMDSTLDNPAGVQSFAANLRIFSTKGGCTPSAQDMPPLATIEPGSRTMIGITRGTSNTIAFATKLGTCGDGGSRYSADPTSPLAAFFGQNAARTTAHYSNPQSTYQWAPRGEECLCTPLMAQTYVPAPLITGLADGTVRKIPGGFSPGIWNAFLHPTGF